MLTTAMAFNMLHLMYRQLTLHFDLYPFNNFRAISFKRRILKSLLDGTLMLFPLIALRMENVLTIKVSSAILLLLLIKAFSTWWIPYFTKSSGEWKIRYTAIFEETINVLPKIRDNPKPNLEHCILHLLTLTSFLFTTLYLILK